MTTDEEKKTRITVRATEFGASMLVERGHNLDVQAFNLTAIKKHYPAIAVQIVAISAQLPLFVADAEPGKR